jgi:hypothetical protein
MTGFIYGNAVLPTRVNLEGAEPAVSELERARVFWLLRRYTSVVYVERQHALLSKLIEGFKAEAARAPDPYTMRYYMQVLGALYQHEAAYERGLQRLRQGKKRAYDDILEGAKVAAYFESRTFYDEGGDLSSIAFGSENAHRLGGLLAWGRRTYTMARNTLRTLQAEWTYQLFQEAAYAEREDVFPVAIDPAPYPAPGALQCSPGDVIPVTGVWLPIDRRLGCPAYLVSQWKAPEAMSTVAVSQSPADDAGGDATYVYERRPSRWELCWEDARYAAGDLGDESEYLSDDISLPSEPLVLLPLP